AVRRNSSARSPPAISPVSGDPEIENYLRRGEQAHNAGARIRIALPYAPPPSVEGKRHDETNWGNGLGRNGRSKPRGLCPGRVERTGGRGRLRADREHQPRAWLETR